MNARQRLEHYLDQVRRRLRGVIVARAGAVAAALLLVVTLAALLWMQQRGVSAPILVGARVGLLAGLLLIGALLLWLPLRRLRVRDGAPELERHLPRQNGRVETYLEQLRRQRNGEAVPLLDLLAEDAATVAESSPVQEAVPRQRLLLPAALALLAVVAMTVLMSLGSYWGSGSRHLWLGMPLPVEQIALREIQVTPGNTTVRRNQDLAIRAAVRGFVPSEAMVHVKFGDSGKWETAAMQAGSGGTFEFTLFALREPMSYYVSSGDTSSREHRVEVVDLPRVEGMRLTYVYPQWTGLKPATEEEARDIRAVAGTRVELEVQTSAPLESPALIVNGASAPLAANGTSARGELVLKQDGHYQISARVGDEQVALTDEYQIRLVTDEKPSIEIARPGRDWHASAIEEVPVKVSANDDFRLQALELHYSVNGGDWQTAKLSGGAREIDTATALRLEDLAASDADAADSDIQGLTPGDIVTYYAVARDRRQSAQTDLFLIQVQPFDRRYRQGQGGGAMQGGGMGGGGDDDISARQREILLATWNLQRSLEDAGSRATQRIEDNARMLAEVQRTLADQARTLVERTRARLLTDADEQIRKFVENLEQAATAMQPAAERLNELELRQAIPEEQKALQHLLRAEALFSDIQVAFQQGGGGGAGGQAGRDLAEMMELEMDLEKNQYETESQFSAERSPQQLDDAIRRLRELAQRQERLAREAARQQATPEAQRWKQEQLRREAEDLRRRLEQLAKQEAERQDSQSQRGQSSQGQSGRGQSSQSGAQGGQAAQALSQLDEALQNMENATGAEGQPGSGTQSGSNARSAQAASRSLREALDQIERSQREGVAGTFENFAERAQQLRERQQQSEQALQEALAEALKSKNPEEAWYKAMGADGEERLANDKRELQTELQSLEQQMRTAAQRHAKEAPQASDQIGDVLTQLSESQVGARLARSALEIERGRPMQAAARDGLITESLQFLEQQLGEAARMAAVESQQGGQGREASPEELLAELGELRRAWQEAQRNAARRDANGRGQQGEPGDARGQESPEQGSQGGDSRGQGAAGQNSPGQDSSGEGGGAGSAVANNWGGGNPRGDWNGGAYSGHFIEGDRGREYAWNPPLAENAFRDVDSAEFQRQAAAIAQRLRELERQLPQGTLAANDIRALRELGDRLRGSGRDPMQSQYARMQDIVDQLELAALTAVKKADPSSPTRTNALAQDSPEYRENVAEYYRRLGAEE